MWRGSELLKNFVHNFDSSQGFLLLLLCVPERGGGREEREKQREEGKGKKEDRGEGEGEVGEGGERRERESFPWLL